jgi:hypothetical protein
VDRVSVVGACTQFVHAIARQRPAIEKVQSPVPVTNRTPIIDPEAELPEGQVWLKREEAETNQLPMVCMICGGPARWRIDVPLSWTPAVLYLLGFLPLLGFIFTLGSTEELSLRAPVCVEDEKHWNRTVDAVGMGLLILLAGAIGIGLTGAFLELSGEVLGWVFKIGGSVAVVAWLIVIVNVKLKTIRPIEITKRHVILKGVSPRFTEAVHHQRWTERRSSTDSRD